MVPGWRAYVTTNGETREHRIHYTDYLFRGIPVDAGSHTVELVYQPWALRIGLWVTLAAMLSLICRRLLRRPSP